MGRFDSQPMRITLTGVMTVVATMLLGVVAMASATDNSTQPVVSGRIAYVPRTTTSTIDKQTALIYMKLPSQESVKLTVSHPLLDSEISGLKWSPDAGSLLFAANAKNKLTVGNQQSKPIPWILDLRTKQVQPITQPREDRDYLKVDWLPDGHRIAAWVLTGKNPDVAWWAGVGPSVKKGGDSRLVVIDTKSKQEITVWRSKYAYFYASSPAHDEFLVWNGDYHLVSANGRLRWTIKGSDTPDTIAFSPDGRKIAVYVAGKLKIIDRNTRAGKVIYTKGGGVRTLVWSPDSKWIAFRESRNEAASYDPPVVDFGWAVTAVNVETKAVHEFPAEVYRQGKYDYTPEVLGWTKDSKNLVLSVPSDDGKWPPTIVRDSLILCPLVGGKGVSAVNITSRIGAVDWLPK